MSWDDVGDAIHAAITRASGLSPQQVIWKGQNIPAPLEDYVTIDLGSILTLGIDYQKVSVNEGGAEGEEIKIEVKGQREVPLEVEVFTKESIAGRKNAALALGDRILTTLVLDSVRNILIDQDISAFDPGAVQWIPDIPTTGFRGRAIATIRCYMPAPSVVEYTTYIERVSGTVEITGGNPNPDIEPFDTADAAPGDED